MIIISNGFPKSASTLLFLYTEELLLRSRRPAAQEKFRKQNAEGFIGHFGITDISAFCVFRYYMVISLLKRTLLLRVWCG